MTRGDRSPALKRALALSPLQRGDLCIYLERPLWGTGIIEWVGPSGRLVASFETPDGPYTDEFGAFELEIAPRPKVIAA